MNLRTDVFQADEAKLLEALQSALAKGEWSGELKQSTKAGAQLLVQSRWTLVRDEAGRPKSVLVINTDVTEQKKLEAQFLRTQRMESIGTLAGGIAHDLNNVLSPIMLAVELMRMKAQVRTNTPKEMLNTMGSSAQARGLGHGQAGARVRARHMAASSAVLQISHLIKEMQKIVKETFPRPSNSTASNRGHFARARGRHANPPDHPVNLCVNACDAIARRRQNPHRSPQRHMWLVRGGGEAACTAARPSITCC